MGLTSTEQMYDWDHDGKLNIEEELRHREFITGEWEEYISPRQPENSCHHDEEDDKSSRGSSGTRTRPIVKSKPKDPFLFNLIKSLILIIGIGFVMLGIVCGTHVPIIITLLLFIVGAFLILIGR